MVLAIVAVALFIFVGCQGESPEPSPTIAVNPADSPTTEPEPTVQPSPTPEPASTPTATPEPEPTAQLSPTAEPAATPTATPEPEPTPEPSPAAELATPPIAGQRPHSYSHHGITLDDPWHWLEDEDYPTVDDEDVIAYLEAENEYFDASMAPHQDLIDTIYAEIEGRQPAELTSLGSGCAGGTHRQRTGVPG